jgi:quercetin dioxygenase-like cupin family protein
VEIFNLEDFPYAEFGQDPVRKVRLIASPGTTGEKRCGIVVTSVPPGGVSEGHVHAESDEYIYFDIGGLFRIDGREYPVKEKSFAFAQKGSVHECVNTSPDRELTLVCFFLPPFEPYGKYPELIEKTREMLRRQSGEGA